MICRAGHDHDTIAATKECDRATQVKDAIKQARDALPKVSAAHWHGGPGPCPVCKPLHTETEAEF